MSSEGMEQVESIRKWPLVAATGQLLWRSERAMPGGRVVLGEGLTPGNSRMVPMGGHIAPNVSTEFTHTTQYPDFRGRDGRCWPEM